MAKSQTIQSMTTVPKFTKDKVIWTAQALLEVAPTPMPAELAPHAAAMQQALAVKSAPADKLLAKIANKSVKAVF